MSHKNSVSAQCTQVYSITAQVDTGKVRPDQFLTGETEQKAARLSLSSPDRQTDRQTDRKTDRQPDRQPDRKTDRQTDKQTKNKPHR